MIGRGCGAVLAAVASLTIVLVPATASAGVARPAQPTGLHVVQVSSSSFTVALKPAAHAAKYRLYASTTRSDLFAHNLSRAEHSAFSRQPRLSIGHVAHKGALYYYRVVAMNGQRRKYSVLSGPVGLRPKPPAHLRTASNPAQTYISWNGGQATGYEIEQSSTPDMSGHQTFYRVRGDANEFTPYGLSKGRKYYFRVRALNGSTPSSFTGTQQTVVQSAQQRVRVMTYNVKEGHFDGEAEGGGHVAPWLSQRRVVQAALIQRAHPDVIGVQEAATLYNIQGHWRQADILRASLGGKYLLANTETPPWQRGTRRTGNYILYRQSAWAPVGHGGHWGLGDRHTAAYQVLRNRSTGAKFLFINAHLWVGLGRASDVKRKQETQALVRHGHRLAKREGVPVVYVGDFNSDTCRGHAFNAPSMVMRSHHIADAYNVAQSRKRANYNTANQYRRRPPHHGDRIDYIFAPHGVGVRSWKLVMKLRHRSFVGTIPSDHNPLVSDLMIPVHR